MDDTQKTREDVSTGMDQLDRLLGHLTLGDNVIFYDASGKQSWPFLLRFIQASSKLRLPLIYVTFDISPKDLLSALGPLSPRSGLTIFDCFTWGEGKGSDLCLESCKEVRDAYAGRLVSVEEPWKATLVRKALWKTFNSFKGEVRLVFDSLTGMQRLWKTEKAVFTFYKETCPKLLERDTVSYWIVKGDFPSPPIRSELNQIAQIAINLSVKRGKDFLTPLKTSERGTPDLGREHRYAIDEHDRLVFPRRWQQVNEIDLPGRIREARTMRGMTQRELARQLGVSASTVSQAESNMILPSLHTLLKMAQVLAVEPSFFFQKTATPKHPLVLSPHNAREMELPLVPAGSAVVRNITPVGDKCSTDIYAIEIPPRGQVTNHFLQHKGEEIGCLLSGTLEFAVDGTRHRVNPGEIVHLTSNVPDEWRNVGSSVAKLLWIRIKQS